MRKKELWWAAIPACAVGLVVMLLLMDHVDPPRAPGLMGEESSEPPEAELGPEDESTHQPRKPDAPLTEPEQQGLVDRARSPKHSLKERTSAAGALATRGSSAAPLLDLLADGDPDSATPEQRQVRTVAILGLARFPNDPRVRRWLLAALEPVAYARERPLAIVTLRNMRARWSLSRLRALDSDPDAEVRAQAARAVKKIESGR